MGFNPSSITSFLTADKSQFQTSSFQTILPRFGWKKGYPISHRIVLWAHCPIIYMTTMANLLQSTTFPQHFPWLLHHLVNLSSLCGFTHGLARPTPVAACYGSEITDDPLAAYGFHREMVMFHEIHHKSLWTMGIFISKWIFIHHSSTNPLKWWFFPLKMVDLHDLLWISWNFSPKHHGDLNGTWGRSSGRIHRVLKLRSPASVQVSGGQRRASYPSFE